MHSYCAGRCMMQDDHAEACAIILMIGGDHAPLYPVLLGSLRKGRRGLFDFATVWYTSISMTPSVCIITTIATWHETTFKTKMTITFWNKYAVLFCMIHQVLCTVVVSLWCRCIMFTFIICECFGVCMDYGVGCCRWNLGKKPWDNHVCPWLLTPARLHKKISCHTLNKVL